mmetsp:Transcript_42011/g.82503  ORF Transcript_42011/g.82503 Transcript_42011/m.82503 type:complete len:640 (-) Transcript_42011:100-2019(-)
MEEIESMRAEIATLKLERAQLSTLRESLGSPAKSNVAISKSPTKSVPKSDFDPSGFDDTSIVNKVARGTNVKSDHIPDRNFLKSNSVTQSHSEVAEAVAAARAELKDEDMLLTTIKLAKQDDVEYDANYFDADAAQSWGGSLAGTEEVKILERDFHREFLGVSDPTVEQEPAAIREELLKRSLRASAAGKRNRRDHKQAQLDCRQLSRQEQVAEDISDIRREMDNDESVWAVRTDGSSSKSNSSSSGSKDPSKPASNSKRKSTSARSSSSSSSRSRSSTVKITSTRTADRRMAMAHAKAKYLEDREDDEIFRERNTTASSQFKARETPWASKVQMFEIIKRKDAEERNRRIQARSEKLYATAKLPPRMETHASTVGVVEKIQQEIAAAKMSEADRNKSGTLTEEHTFKPKINRTAPDFEAERKSWNKKIASVSERKAPTSFKEFKLSKNPERKARKRAQARKGIDLESTEMRIGVTGGKPSEFSRMKMRQTPTYLAGTTLKAQDLARKRREEIKEREAQETAHQRALDARAAEREYMREKLRGKVRSDATAEKIRQNTIDARRAQKERDKAYKEQVKSINDKVRERPLLLDMDRIEKNRASARIKALQKIKDSLDSSGITDYKRYFDKDELEELGLDFK